LFPEQHGFVMFRVLQNGFLHPSLADLTRVLAGGANQERNAMRISTASVIIAALSLGTPAWVQAQGAQPKAPPQAQSDQSTVIRSIEVVNIKDLTPEVRSKVEDVVAKASEDDLRQLRDSIDASPEAVSALKAKGLSSSQVVAVTLTTNGVLTLFAKTAGRNQDSLKLGLNKKSPPVHARRVARRARRLTSAP
jgi:hypothetical protein